ncbi:DHA2 family efflux MFS transporter permease subunit [Heyndrickxia acidicola]|uniref:DHA2 family efflux MFS transporter permease subunit n=1 Tax=Heyndrickxia acidicola TaxID=209389 RepID=A0ABU6MIG2_9BACI|nr:MFS transporter [Heyndrickxia acidicola]MED1203042.1 DHA2 family efflux MFS transporter permease subunit [Heyndrickxia acidicola]
MSSIGLTYQEDENIQKNRWKILIILNLFVFMSTLDGSIVNIALPVISKDLSLPIAKAEWIVSSYLIAICTIILFFGKLGDILGKIKVFRIGTLIFIVGSLLSGFSSSLSMLVIFRVIQALGASMTMANSQGIVTDIFPSRERGKALGLIGTFVSLGSIAGPSLGGGIVSALGWQYIFWVNVPIGIIAIVLGWKLLPKDLTMLKTKIDIQGSLLFAVFVISLFSGLLLGQQTGYSNPLIISSFALALIAFLIFLLVERHKAEPMLHLPLFKNPLFTVSILCGFLVFVANFCFNIISPFYSENILQLSPLSSGCLLMLFPITMAVTAPLSGALSDRIGSELLTFLGLLVMVMAQIGLATLHNGSPVIFVGVLVAMLGLGSGLFQSPNNSLVMSTVPRTKLGIAGSVNSLVRNIGMIVGISLATTTLFSVMSQKAGHRVTSMIPHRPDIFLAGMHVVFIGSASICLVSALLTGWRLYKKNSVPS